MIDGAIDELAPIVGTTAALAAVGLDRASWYRRHRQSPRPERPDDGGSDRSALPAFELLGFSGPPAEPDVRLSPHPALHRFMPLVRVILLSRRSSMVWGCGRAGSGIE